jgi:hypothetical protein
MVMLGSPDWVIAWICRVDAKTAQYWRDRCLDAAVAWSKESVLSGHVWIDEMRFAPTRASGFVDGVWETYVGRISKDAYMEVAFDSMGHGFCEVYAKLGTPYGSSVERCLEGRVAEGLHLYFNFVSDVAVTGNIVIRFSEEVEAYTFNKDNYDIQLNNTAIDYPAVSFTASEVPAQTAAITVASFKDFTILSNATIKKGYNYLHLTTANSDAVSGTTMTAHAPIVDCVKITVDNAVLTWDGRSGLPAKNY